MLLAAALLSLLVLDTNVFIANRFHLSLLSAALFEWQTWTFTGIMFVILLVFESLLAGMIWRDFALAQVRAAAAGWRRTGARLAWWHGPAHLGRCGRLYTGDAVHPLSAALFPDTCQA